ESTTIWPPPAGSGIPATAAVAVAADCLMNSRRVSFIRHLFVHCLEGFAVLIDERRRHYSGHAPHPLDAVENRKHARALEGDDDLPLRVDSMDFGIRNVCDRRGDPRQLVRPHMDQDASQM